MDRNTLISKLLIKITDLTRIVGAQAGEIKVLIRDNADLRERLGKFENPKNSRNSSIPPSRDEIHGSYRGDPS